MNDNPDTDIIDTGLSENYSQIPRTSVLERLATDFDKPKDWQSFQRNCVVLFREVLNDPHTQQYGRSGQKQHGIDIIGRRNGDVNWTVGIQCRLITSPLNPTIMEKDVRASLEGALDLKEFLFVTTAPDDVRVSDAARDLTKKLQSEGHELSVIAYGWGQLQELISIYETAFNVFRPSALSIGSRQQSPIALDHSTIEDLAGTLLKHLNGSLGPIPIAGGEANTNEDPSLHARIDVYRDLFRSEGQFSIAEQGLLKILSGDLTGKPWASFRVETNLGALALEVGRQDEAALRFENAHRWRPTDPDALANLALARTIQGRLEEAVEAANAALSATPQSKRAVTYLLQAAARSDWEGDPDTLIPPGLLGSEEADLGLAEFLRRRETPGWAERCLELSRRHPGHEEFKIQHSISVLSIALASGSMVPGGYGPISAEEINKAANQAKAYALRCLAVCYADKHDLFVHVNNAAVLLRLCERLDEEEQLLTSALSQLDREPQLVRLLAMAQWAQNNVDAAVATLEGDPDPENRILLAELRSSTGSPRDALDEMLLLSEAEMPERLQRFRHRIIAECAIVLDEATHLADSVARLRQLEPEGIASDLLTIRFERNKGGGRQVFVERLRRLAESKQDQLDMVQRYLLALELRNAELFIEGSRVLDSYVDLSRPSPATLLYLQCLAGARRDETFRQVIAAASPAILEEPATLWVLATHGWNTGDLNGSLSAVRKILEVEPGNTNALMLKIELLLRLDRSSEILMELEKPLERLHWQKVEHQYRVASLLGALGFIERAAAFSYKLYLAHRDSSRAWLTLSMLVLNEGRNADTQRGWMPDTVGVDCAVDVHFEGGSKSFFVLEPDPELRAMDPESWELDHPLAATVLGLKEGARFISPSGEQGVIHKVRHKYVARLHYVLAHHDKRFPHTRAFKEVVLTVGDSGNTDALRDEVRTRSDWVREQEQQYINGPMPIGALSSRVGSDVIDVSLGLVSNGVKLKVASGNARDFDLARISIIENSRRGFVPDLLALWTAWRLEALEAVLAVGGPMHLPRSVVDDLKSRRDRLSYFAQDGMTMAGCEENELSLRQVPASIIVSAISDMDGLLKWIEDNASVDPLIIQEDLPASLREHLRAGQSGLFDSLVLARQLKLLFVSDDRPTREFDRVLGGGTSAWLHTVFSVALTSQKIARLRYVELTASLLEAGHMYLGVTGAMLFDAIKIDKVKSSAPGSLTKSLCGVIGGREADPVSHIKAVLECLDRLWSDDDLFHEARPVTGFLIRALVRERKDADRILRTLIHFTDSEMHLNRYLRSWVYGHFYAPKVFGAS